MVARERKSGPSRVEARDIDFLGRSVHQTPVLSHATKKSDIYNLGTHLLLETSPSNKSGKWVKGGGRFLVESCANGRRVAVRPSKKA